MSLFYKYSPERYNEPMKSMIWLGLFVGSTIGSLLPMLWGGDIFSLSSIIGSAVGGILGIWLGYKVGQSL